MRPFLQDTTQDATPAAPDTTGAVLTDGVAGLIPEPQDSAPLDVSVDRVAEFMPRLLDPDLWVAFGVMVLKIVLILMIAVVLIRLSDKAMRRWMQRFVELPPIHPRRRRAFTISTLLSSSTRYVVWPIAIIMVLAEAGINITALLATAGVAGLAIGFGAQTLVKDVIGGVFLLFDDTVHVGDFVRIGADEGTVEDIGVRLIKVRKFNGELLMVPAGDLRVFGNRSIGFARVIVEVGLSYEQDLDTVVPIMEEVAHRWAEEHASILKEDAPQVQSITAFMDSSVNARIVVQVIPGEQWLAERELRARLKRAFDMHGIEIPFPCRTVYMRQEPELPSKHVAPSADTPPQLDGEGQRSL